MGAVNVILFDVFVIILLLDLSYAMTRAQLKNSGKMMKKSCMPKNDVTEEQIGQIEQGKFNEERNVMCYIACIYQMGQIIKNNKLSYEAVVKQVDMMFPADMKDAVKAAATHCKDIDKISKIEQGVFIEDPKVMCYITCIYRSLQVIKNERLDMDLIAKQVDILYPNDMKEPVRKAVAKCFHVQDQYNELCQAVFYAVKCLYEADPPNFVFP